MIEINELPAIATSIVALIILNAILVLLKRRYILSEKFFARAYSIFYGLNIVILSMLFFKSYYQYARPVAMLDLLFLFSMYVFRNQYNGLFAFLCYIVFRSGKPLQSMPQDASRSILSVLKSICLCFCQFTIVTAACYEAPLFVFILFILFLLALTDIAEMFVNNNINLRTIFINQIKYFFAIMSLILTYNVFVFILCLSLDYCDSGIRYIKRRIA